MNLTNLRTKSYLADSRPDQLSFIADFDFQGRTETIEFALNADNVDREWCVATTTTGYGRRCESKVRDAIRLGVFAPQNQGVAAVIQSREAAFSLMLAALEAKYGAVWA